LARSLRRLGGLEQGGADRFAANNARTPNSCVAAFLSRVVIRADFRIRPAKRVH